MRVDHVDKSKGIGYIKFNSDTEMDLVAESIDRLVAKQKRMADKTAIKGSRGNVDKAELQKLERFKQAKFVVVDVPKQQRMQLQRARENVRQNAINEIVKKNPHFKGKNMVQIQKEGGIDIEDTEEFKRAAKIMQNAEIGGGLAEGTEVTHRNMHILANALNEHIWDMEKDGLVEKNRRNKNKYEKLVQLLNETQEQKSRFERVREKPRGFGRLRK